MAAWPDFTMPVNPLLPPSLEGREIDAKGLAEEHRSLGSFGQRKELKGQFAYAFIPFHTLQANSLWKVPSQFPPRGS